LGCGQLEARIRSRTFAAFKKLTQDELALHRGLQLQKVQNSPDGHVIEGPWKERWYVERGGKLIAFDVIFTAGPDGTFFSVATRPF
jgi:hypothetical protein